MFRSLIALCIVIYLLPSTTLAQLGTDGADADWNLDLSPTNIALASKFRSKYVFSNDAVVYDKPVIQTDLFLTFKIGLFFDLWTSIPADITDLGANYGTEAMLTLGWGGKVNNFNLNLSVEYEDLHHTLKPEGTDFLILVGEVSRDLKLSDDFTVSPFIHLETNFTFDGGTRGDTLPRIGSRFCWQMTEILSLTGKAMVVYDPGILGGDTGWIANAEAALNWKLGQKVDLEAPYVRIVEPIGSFSDNRHEEVIWGFGLTFKF